MVKTTLSTIYQLFSKEDAIVKAAEMKGNDPDWDYTPVHCPKGTGYSFIEVYDEDGEYISRM